MIEDNLKRRYHYGYNKSYDIERIKRRKVTVMPRVGMNPLRDKALDFPLPPDVPVVAIITHLPHENEYHEQRREIVEAAVMSAKLNAGTDAHFVIFDNGSHYEMREWLSHLGADRVILSRNVGKMNAVKAIADMYPSSVIAISDDDILHYDNWLVDQLELLSVADYVSGCTTKYYMKYNHLRGLSIDKFGEDELFDSAIYDANVPLEWDIQHGASIGKSHAVSAEMNNSVKARILRKGNTVGFVGGNHCQFVAHSRILRIFFEKTDRYMQPLYPVDVAIDETGFIRMLTVERKTRHLGNVLSKEDRKEISNVVGTF